MNLNQSGIALLFSAVFAVSTVSSAFAGGEKTSDIEKARVRKFKIVNYLHQTLARHQRMSLEDVKYEMKAQLEQNRQALQQAGKLTPEVVAKINQAEAKVTSFKTKEALLAEEMKGEKAMVSAPCEMFSFMFTGGLFDDADRDPSGFSAFVAFFLWPVTLSMDIAILPLTIIMDFAGCCSSPNCCGEC